MPKITPKWTSLLTCVTLPSHLGMNSFGVLEEKVLEITPEEEIQAADNYILWNLLICSHQMLLKWSNKGLCDGHGMEHAQKKS